jgi:intermediate peptidase
MSLLSHTHFVNYGAGYYSYLLAKMYSSHIFDRHFKVEPNRYLNSIDGYSEKLLSRESGMKVWRDMLIYGASRDPSEILNNLVGGQLNPSYYLEPLIGPLSRANK